MHRTLLRHTVLGLLLSVSLAALPQGRQGAAVPLRGINGALLGTSHTMVQSVGGQVAPPLGNLAWALPFGNRTFRIGLSGTGTMWRERLVLGVPDVISGPLPVLVLFHGYGEEPEQTVVRNQYLEKARQKGWLVVVPLGAHKYNFGIDYAQQNTEAALEFVARYFPLDVDRVYGIGFSMGGGWMSSFAARHNGREHLRFAALVNHTGTVSIADVHQNAISTSLLESPLMFGGTPFAVPFRYSTASSLDLITATNTVDQGTDLVRNIGHTPILTWTCQADPLFELVNQCERFEDQRLLRGASAGYQNGPSAVAGLLHDWRTIDEDQVLDWLATKSLSMPSGTSLVKVLADRDGGVQHFTLAQRQSGAFSPFEWAVQVSQNRVGLLAAENIASIAFDPADLSLDRTQMVEVLFQDVDGLDSLIVLEDMDLPSTVVLDGVPTSAWSYDAQTRRLALSDPAGGTFSISTWRVYP